MQTDDGYVVIGNEAAPSAKQEVTEQGDYVSVLKAEGVEEVSMTFAKVMYEDDVRKGFPAGREAVWKQFSLDVNRQSLCFDGYEARICSDEKLVKVMLDLVSKVHTTREVHFRKIKETEEEAELERDRRRRERELRMQIQVEREQNGGLVRFGIAKLAKWLENLLTVPAVTDAGSRAGGLWSWLMGTPASDTGDEPPAAPSQPLASVKTTIAVVNNDEDAVENATLVLAGTAPLPLNPPAIRCIQPPVETPLNAAFIHHVDNLAMFCQQGVFGRVFELLNESYTSHEFRVHVSNAKDSMRIQVVIETNEYGEPDLSITIKKSFKLFHVNNDARQMELVTLNTKIVIFLFSGQLVQVDWQGKRAPTIMSTMK